MHIRSAFMEVFALAKRKKAVNPAQATFAKQIAKTPFIPLNEAREMSLKQLEAEYRRYRKTFNERIRRMTKDGTEAQLLGYRPYRKYEWQIKYYNKRHVLKDAFCTLKYLNMLKDPIR